VIASPRSGDRFLRFKLASEILTGGSSITADGTEDAVDKARAMLRLGAKRLKITDENGQMLSLQDLERQYLLDPKGKP
jgi:hypothetical protein